MKRILLTSILAVLVAFGTTVMAQEYPDEYLGLPGDNLNLYAVMKLFQESETLEAFERNLNNEKSGINNLDLNGDNYVDYIMVFDYVDGDVHTIVLRVALDKNEFQDVAVFTVQRFPNRSVQIQLIGDEALYGKNYIIEPNYAETPNPGYIGKPKRNVTVNMVYTSYYDIASWPVVRFIYFPEYVLWRSSWYWGYHPDYWNPWHPWFWHYYYGYHYNWYHHYYTHYHHWYQPRYQRFNEFYSSGVRLHSPQVHQKINEGAYKSAYSHPEQRKDGEALFIAMHPDQEKRTAQNTPVISRSTGTGRRSAATGGGNITGTDHSPDKSTGVSRRTTSSDNDKPVSKSSSDRNEGVTRKSSGTVNDRPVTKPASDQSTNVSRRPATYVNERPVLKSSSDNDQNTSARRTSVSTPEREVSKSRTESSQKSSEARKQESPKVSQPAKSRSENRASSETRTVKTEKRSEKTQKPEDTERSVR
jgi:hypothetical protein